MKQTLVKIFAEGLLIIFSVLLAFWIDNRYQSIGNSKLKTHLLTGIYSEMQDDSSHLSNYFEMRHDVSSRLNSFLDNPAAYTTKVDSLIYFLDVISVLHQFTANNATYLSIINSGQIELFEQDTLFEKIEKYYWFNDIVSRDTKDYKENVKASLNPYVSKHFDRRLFDEKRYLKAEAINFKEFESREFINLLYSLKSSLPYEDWILQHLTRQKLLLTEIRQKL